MGDFSKLEWMDAVRQSTAIPAGQRLAIEDIGSTANKDGSDAWRDNRTVAHKLDLSERTVTRARESAAKHGLWVEVRPADSKRTARYRLILPPGWGDTTVYPNDPWGDTTVQLGRHHCPVGVTPLSTASGITSGFSSDERYVSNAGARDDAETIQESDCDDYWHGDYNNDYDNQEACA
jgi:hypothetical protein